MVSTPTPDGGGRAARQVLEEAVPNDMREARQYSLPEQGKAAPDVDPDGGDEQISDSPTFGHRDIRTPDSPSQPAGKPG